MLEFQVTVSEIVCCSTVYVQDMQSLCWPNKHIGDKNPIEIKKQTHHIKMQQMYLVINQSIDQITSST